MAGLLLSVACASRTTPSEVTPAPPTQEMPPQEAPPEQEKPAGTPSTNTPESGTIIECDPVSGRAGQISLRWKSDSIAIGYQIQIALEQDFTVIVVDIGGSDGIFYYPPAPESPALIIPAGGGQVIDARGNRWTVPGLPTGTTYYWRVRVRDVATGGAILSPWSSPGILIVKIC
jgi:hypothetical protein